MTLQLLDTFTYVYVVSTYRGPSSWQHIEAVGLANALINVSIDWNVKLVCDVQFRAPQVISYSMVVRGVN